MAAPFDTGPGSEVFDQLDLMARSGNNQLLPPRIESRSIRSLMTQPAAMKVAFLRHAPCRELDGSQTRGCSIEPRISIRTSVGGSGCLRATIPNRGIRRTCCPGGRRDQQRRGVGCGWLNTGAKQSLFLNLQKLVKEMTAQKAKATAFCYRDAFEQI